MNKQTWPGFHIPESWKDSYRPWPTQRHSGWVDASLLEHLDQDQLEEPGRLLRLTGAEVVRSRRNLTARIFLGGRPVWIKQFRPGHAVDRLAYALKPGKAVFAWNAAMVLMEHGFRTPRPLIGLRPVGGTPAEGGIIAFEEIVGRTSLRETLAGEARQPAERDEVLYDLGVCLRRFHDLGFRHRDLRQGNILTARSGDGYSFCFLDLNRLRVQRPLTDIQRLREVEKLNLPSEGLELFFRAYMPGRGSTDMARMYEDRVGYADRLGRLWAGKLLRKTWYYYWELWTFSRSRRP